MSQRSSEYWNKARRARDKLVEQFLDHPDVSLIDIGYDQDAESMDRADQIVLRVHVRERWIKARADDRIAFPERVEGIRVVVTRGEYDPASSSPAQSEESNHPSPESRSTAMGSQQNVATSASDDRSDLGFTISDEMPGQCMALAKSTGKRCKKAASPGSKYCPVHQRVAALQAPPANTDSASLEEDASGLSQEAHSKKRKEWKQRAGFSVFFDYKIDRHGKEILDEHGRRIWQTRVYDNKSGAEEPLSGIDTAPWVNWVLERADLPVAAEPISSDAEEEVRPAPVAEPDAQIEILAVELSPLGPSSGVPEKRLRAEVRFRVSGTDAETMAAKRVPFWTQFYLVDLESEIMNLVTSDHGQLQPEDLEYTSQQSFAIPDLGRYELQSIVLLLPPGERMALQKGPTLKVVP